MTAGGSASDRRRPKAALFLVACGWAGMAPHWLDPVRGLLPALTLAVLLGGYSLRTVLLSPRGRRAVPAPRARRGRHPAPSSKRRATFPAWMWWWPPATNRR